MKKIAYLLGSLNRGGTETLMLDVFKNAKANDLDAIGIYRKTGVCEQEFCDSRVEMFKLSPTKNIFNYLLKLRQLIKNQDIQIVHAQQPLDALYAYFALVGTGVKIMLTLHGFDFTENKVGGRIHKFILRRTDLNIYVSTYQKEYYTTKYKLNSIKQVIIYNGISLDKLNFSDANFSIRTTLKLKENALLLGTVGNFVAGRDQFTICKFLKLLNDAKIDFHFLFIGKRSEKFKQKYDECVEFVNSNNLSDKVHFLGSRNDVPQLLKSMDAFIYSTDHDTFGIAVAEALACELPVFVNDWSVMTEITENGKLATLYKTKDEHDLFRHFLLFLQDKKLFYDKAKLASKTVLNKYSIEKHIQNLKKMYLLSNH